MTDIRNKIIESLHEEIIGPSSDPKYSVEINGEVREVLLQYVHGSPQSRYGAGMLYPKQTYNMEASDCGKSMHNKEEEEHENEEKNQSENISGTSGRNSNFTEQSNSDEEPVSLANQFLPSAMGFTIMLNNDEIDSEVILTINSAKYIRGQGEVQIKKYTESDGVIYSKNKKEEHYTSPYWIREPLNIEPTQINVKDILLKEKSYTKVLKRTEDGDEGDEWLTLQVYNRSSLRDKKENLSVFTFVIINSKEASGSAVDNQYILYQNKLTIETDNPSLIHPYREKHVVTDTEEEEEMNLLYRNKRIFAIGHGASVEWDSSIHEEKESVQKIQTSVVPVYEMPQIAPTSYVELSMLELSDKGDWAKALSSLELLVAEYQAWVEKILQKANSSKLAAYKEAALRNVEKCKQSLIRIKRGFDILKNAGEEDDIVMCFRWMNRAMIWQQQRSKAEQRKWIEDGSNLVLEPIEDGNQDFLTLEEYHSKSKYNGRWRPFQLAFVLMNIDAIINPTESKDRDLVDLIWFPTGGGKTEAYLGVAAFSIFYRRLKGNFLNKAFYGGTSVLMRYTLRLLTAQQYERASSLICACDLIREDNIFRLGAEPISIGLWVGASSTPNKKTDAISQYKKLLKDPKNTPYNFIVMKCPCCGAKVGKNQVKKKKGSSIKIRGIKREDGNKGDVIFSCDNNRCEYHNKKLPLYVIDEDIYSVAPTFIIGTVDKFAMVPWKIQSGAIFGFRGDEEQGYSRIKPPELIIQDELHLISGPLGTMVGMYETLVQTLCNDYSRTAPPFIMDRKDDFIPPKIIASSATISRAKEQVKSLYATEKMSIFPAQGLSFGDTWFSKEEDIRQLDSEGMPKFPGRKYVGVLASGYPSSQTAIVRSYSSVLQKAKELENSDNIDFYWTLLGYFNSIRELGGASSLVYGDIRERLNQIQNRELIPFKERRKLFDGKIQELTSRIPSSQIPLVLKKLEQKITKESNKSLDICLATNMVATGLDVSRLGLMFIHGQPKTTAEYIQASSRVGRRPPTGPGLIFTLYSPTKPRDKSQYEQFQGYHSRIYSKVEPTSVTPFSINVRERALHAILIGLVRHFSATHLRKRPILEHSDFNSLIAVVFEIIMKRCEIVDSTEYDNTEALLERRILFWQNRGVQEYGDAINSTLLNNLYPLMYSNSFEAPDDILNYSISTPTSMRGVDSESSIKIIGS